MQGRADGLALPFLGGHMAAEWIFGAFLFVFACGFLAGRVSRNI